MKKGLGFFCLGIFLLGLIGVSRTNAQNLVIKIGVVGALTGDFSAVGNSQLTGAQMKAKEINDSGGNVKVELIA